MEGSLMKGGRYTSNPPAAPSGRLPQQVLNIFQEEADVSKKQKTQPIVRKPTKQIADPRRIRFGSGFAPAKLMERRK